MRAIVTLTFIADPTYVHELKFFTRYWRGEAIPTTMARKCAICLYNLLEFRPVPRVSYGEQVSKT